jgi:Flp pilus assembly pilin Flp
MNKVISFWKRFWNNEDGIGTLEIILILAVIVVIAFIFKDYIMNWIDALLSQADTVIEGDSSTLQEQVEANDNS